MFKNSKSFQKSNKLFKDDKNTNRSEDDHGQLSMDQITQLKKLFLTQREKNRLKQQLEEIQNNEQEISDQEIFECLNLFQQNKRCSDILPRLYLFIKILPFFQDICESLFIHFIKLIAIKRNHQEQIFEKGQEAQYFVIVLSGKLMITDQQIDDKLEELKVHKYIEEGYSYGDLNLYSGSNHPYFCYTQDECILLHIDKKFYRQYVKQNLGNQIIQKHQVLNKQLFILTESNKFKNMQIENLFLFEEVVFKMSECIIKEKSYQQFVYIVIDGQIDIYKQDNQQQNILVKRLSLNSLIGFQEVLNQEQFQYSVICSSKSYLYKINKENLQTLISKNICMPDLIKTSDDNKIQLNKILNKNLKIKKQAFQEKKPQLESLKKIKKVKNYNMIQEKLQYSLNKLPHSDNFSDVCKFIVSNEIKKVQFFQIRVKKNQIQIIQRN